MKEILYPLRFDPILKDRIWGGHRLYDIKGIDPDPAKIGERWEISGVPGNVSVVAGGCLKGRNLNELTDTFKGKLVGDKVYRVHGNDFPVLIKLIDARDDLSIQVHPNDELARQRHGCPGKTEMWVVMEAEPDAALYVGFNRQVAKEEYLHAVRKGTLPSLLKREPVWPGDAFFIPAGTIHAIGKGCLIAEIQQTSDITYRVDDWGRTDGNGNPRELHTELALGAIDFSAPRYLNVTKTAVPNQSVNLIENQYFTTNHIKINGKIDRDYSVVDSFVIYMCINGKIVIESGIKNMDKMRAGESLFIPATLKTIRITGDGEFLEVYL